MLCVTLQDLQLHTSQLQQQKYRGNTHQHTAVCALYTAGRFMTAASLDLLQVFLQVLRVLLGDREHADVIHEQQRQVRAARDRKASAQSLTERVLCPAGGGAASEGRVCG